MGWAAGVDNDQYLRDRVYFTVDRRLAAFHASAWAGRGGGSLYQVDPIGAIEHDPDFAEGISFQSRSARILKIVQVNVWMSPLEMNQVLAPHCTSEDGSPQCDAKTGLQLAPAFMSDDPEVLAMLEEANRHLILQEANWRSAR